MPSRNTLKLDAPRQFYHVYARGNNKDDVFLDSQDCSVFLNLFKRYLSNEQQENIAGRPYIHLYGNLELLAYCLMDNHFHLLIYQQEEGAMSKLMKGVMTSYSRYFNTRYNRNGRVWESRYKASIILQDHYLHHISRYIHLNPKEWEEYPFSSLPYYLGKQSSEWLLPGRIMELFSGSEEYIAFLRDYEDHKKALEQIKYELAN